MNHSYPIPTKFSVRRSAPLHRDRVALKQTQVMQRQKTRPPNADVWRSISFAPGFLWNSKITTEHIWTPDRSIQCGESIAIWLIRLIRNHFTHWSNSIKLNQTHWLIDSFDLIWSHLISFDLIWTHSQGIVASLPLLAAAMLCARWRDAPSRYPLSCASSAESDDNSTQTFKTGAKIRWKYSKITSQKQGAFWGYLRFSFVTVVSLRQELGPLVGHLATETKDQNTHIKGARSNACHAGDKQRCHRVMPLHSLHWLQMVNYMLLLLFVIIW